MCRSTQTPNLAHLYIKYLVIYRYKWVVRNTRPHYRWDARPLQLSRFTSSSLSSMNPSSSSRLSLPSSSATVLRRCSSASRCAESMFMPTIISPSSSRMLILSFASDMCACCRQVDGRNRRMMASAIRSHSEDVCAVIVSSGRY